MVVTRRQNTAPMPAVASRTNSNAATPRLRDVKSTESSPLKATTTGEAASAPRSQNGNATSFQKSAAGPQSLADIKFDDDVKRSSSSSKGPATSSKSTSKSKQKGKSKKLSKAKKHRPPKRITIFDVLARLALLFFIIYTVTVCPDDVELRSPVCRALTEYRRNILEPYVYPHIRTALEHPSIAPHVQRIQPYCEHAVKITTPVYYRGKHEWRTKVIPRLRWIQIRARPYIRQANRRLDKIFGPYVQRLSMEYSRRLAPHVTTLEVKLMDKWSSAKLWAYPLWRLNQRLPYILVRNIVEPLGQARRQYVDPHVAKIWDAIAEQSKANKEGLKTTVKSTVSTVPSVDVSESAPEIVSTTSSLEVTPLTESLTAKTEVDPIESSTHSQEIPDTVETSTLKASASVPVEVPVLAATEGDAASAASVVEESLFPNKPSESSPPTSPVEEDESDPDIEAYISELIQEDETPEIPQPPQPPQEEVDRNIYMYKDETPEQRDARFQRIKEENKEKRAEIQGRHTKWEEDLQTLGNSKIEQVIIVLGRIREAAAKEAQIPGETVRIQVDILTTEAEKSLKSLRVYGKKLVKEDKEEAEKITLWEDVLNKVEKKFGQKVDRAADAVREWWSTQTAKEFKEIDAIVNEVKDLAGEAQNDLGMDYAWLGDVTYEDWQRYHRLMDTSEQFKHVYLGLQNGTREDAPANLLQEVIQDLQDEVDEMVLGFEANIGIIKLSILDQFSIDAGTNEPQASDSTPVDEPKVSILPIGSGPGEQERKSRLEEISQAILSRDPEEIKGAASRASEATGSIREEL